MTTCNATQTPHGRITDVSTDCSCKDTGKARECRSDDFWARQKWLASTIEKRLQSLGAQNTRVSPTVQDVGSDPMLLFVRALAHSAVIKTSHMARERAPAAVSSARPSCTVEQLHSAAHLEYEASSATAEIALLAKQMPSLGYFKMPPFLPSLLG